MDLKLARVRRPAAPAGPEAPPFDDVERALDEAYWLILGRAPDEEGKRFYLDQLEGGTLTFADICAGLARSPEFFDRLRPHDPPPAPPPPEVDVRDLLSTLTVEELAESADAYFRQMGNPDYYLAKPLTNVDEAPDFLICFGALVAGLRPLPGMVVLDFGAGTCWTSRWLSQLGCEVVALDVSATALALGQELYERLPVVGDRPPARFIRFDGRTIDLPDASVDRIFCFDSFHHVPNQAEVLGEMARVLRHGGVAGFSEPGPHHSKTAQSQFEMKNYDVIENDIVMDEVWALAQAAGFTRLDLALFSAEPFRVDTQTYDAFLARRFAPTDAYADHVRSFASGRRNFFLAKGDVAAGDSRDRRGLFGELEVSVGEGTVTARNTGAHAWLTDASVDLGRVQVGVHLYDAGGKLVDRDFARIPLPAGGVAPGASVSAPFRLEGLPAGPHRVEFDLVSEHVCWFEINGCRPVSMDIEASGAPGAG